MPRHFARSVVVLVLVARAAWADVLTVTSGADDPLAPQPGTLRHALTVAAKPGDVIQFEAGLSITVRGKAGITVGKQLEGVRIQGPVKLESSGVVPARVHVQAKDAVIDDVDFDHVSVELEGLSGAPILGAKVTGCSFETSGTVTLRSAEGCFVERNTFALLPFGGVSIAISGRDLVNCRVADNVIDVLDPSSARGVSLLSTSGCTIEHNRVNDGSIQVFAASGSVILNTTTNGSIFVDAHPDGQKGAVEVRGNHCDSLRAAVLGAIVTSNEIGFDPPPKKAKPGVVGLEVADKFAGGGTTFSGPITVSSNKVKGGVLQSILVTTGPRTTDVVIADNVVTEPAKSGIVVSTRTPTTLRKNSVAGGTGAESFGIRLLRTPDGDGTFLDENAVTDVDGVGVALSTKARAKLTKNQVLRCGRQGVVVSTGGVLVSDGDFVRDNLKDGFAFGLKSRGAVRDSTVTGNTAAGVFIDKGALVEVRRTTFGGNGGLGVDVAPRGVTRALKGGTGNPGARWPTLLEFDTETRSVRGFSNGDAVVEIFRVEDGARAGNPRNGEGVSIVAQAVVSNGEFTVPVACDDGDVLTVTATRRGVAQGAPPLPGKPPITSEFSEDVVCVVELDHVSQSTSGEVADDRSATNTEFYSLETNACVNSQARHVVFTSFAMNLAPGATERTESVYLRDTQAGTTTRVSRTSHGGPFAVPPSITLKRAGFAPSISESGQYVVYATDSDEVIAGDKDGRTTIVAYDVSTGLTEAVTDPTQKTVAFPDGRFTHLGGVDPSVSGDGNSVAFVSIDGNWTGGDLEDDNDVFVWRRVSGAIERVSVPTGGGDVSNPGFLSASEPRLSHDGSKVVFISYQVLVPGATPSGPKVYLRDGNVTLLVSRNSAGEPNTGGNASISADGEWVCFASVDPLVPQDIDGFIDVYLWKRQDGSLRRISVKDDGSPFGMDVHSPTMDDSAQRFCFVLSGGWFPPEGLSIVGIDEVWFADLVAGTVHELVDASSAAFAPRLSRDGRAVVFMSNATNLLPSVATLHQQVFLKRLAPAGQ